MPANIEQILRGCFHPKEGKANLKQVPINIGRAREHVDKAHANLRAMKLMYDNDLFDWTIVCGYYAMYLLSWPHFIRSGSVRQLTIVPWPRSRSFMFLGEK
ncbi:MAG: hypothetical protein WCI27_05805 [Candidatus Omnitrophota bacterium]